MFSASANEIYDNELINFEISKLQELSQKYSNFTINKLDLKKINQPQKLFLDFFLLIGNCYFFIPRIF